MAIKPWASSFLNMVFLIESQSNKAGLRQFVSANYYIKTGSYEVSALRKTVHFVFFGREVQTLEINLLNDARYAVSAQILCEQDIDGNGGLSLKSMGNWMLIQTETGKFTNAPQIRHKRVCG